MGAAAEPREYRRGLVNTRHLVAATAVMGAGLGAALAPSEAQARVYWKACVYPRTNEYGASHPKSQSVWNWGWADTGCSASIQGVPCIGDTANGELLCGTRSHAVISGREFYLVANTPYFRLCGNCSGVNYGNRHYTEASSY